MISVSDLIFWQWEKPKEVSTQRRRDSEKTDINTDNNHLGPGFMLSFYWVLCNSASLCRFYLMKTQWLDLAREKCRSLISRAPARADSISSTPLAVSTCAAACE